MLALLGIVTGLVSLLLGTGTNTSSLLPDAPVLGMPMFWSYFNSPGIMILNLLPPVILIFFVYFASGRAWIAFDISSLITLALSTIHYLKIQIRGDPLVASDYAYFNEARKVMSPYTPAVTWKIYLAIAVFICGAVFSFFILKRRLKKAPARIAGGVAAVAVFSLLYVTVYTDTELYASIAAYDRFAQWSESLNYIERGFLYPFIHSVRDARPEVAKPPTEYDEDEVQLAFESYGNADIPDEKKVNVICIMLESYTDLSAFDAIDFKLDVYSPLHRLQSESVRGKLISNVFAGNTINTERFFLTGFTHFAKYDTVMNSHVDYLNSQGYFTEGFTAVEGWFYERKNANHHFGFSEYYFLEDYENGNQEDSFFFSVVRDLYGARDKTKPYFSFNLSAQNHGPYPHWSTDEPYYIAQEGLSPEAFCILNNYLSGIQDTTLRLERFIDGLRGGDDPVVVLVCGDHMPWLGNNDHVYAELGINIDTRTQEGFYNYYSTPYLIWANEAAKGVLGNDFTGDGRSFSPGFFMGELFRLCSWEGSGYMQALRELQASVDIISTPTGIFRENGVLTLNLSLPAAEAYNKLRKIEYFWLNNSA
jgi:phosphoglycerol transferase MdoB-like AlkP superfamily enzyme